MRQGSISQAVCDRSLTRPLEAMGVLTEEKSGQTARPDGWEAVCSTSMGAVDGFCMPSAEMILAETLNRLGPAREVRLTLGLILPKDLEEEGLKDLVLRCGRMAEEAGAGIGKVEAEVTDAVMQPCLSASAEGIRPAWAELGACSDRRPSGLDLVMAGPCGLAGSLVLADSFPDRLSRTLPEHFLKRAGKLREGLLLWKKAGKLREELPLGKKAGKLREESPLWKRAEKAGTGQIGDPEEEGHAACQRDETRLLEGGDAGGMGRIGAFRAVDKGGIFAALWNLCDHLGCGLEADLQRIPICQETVEICEALNRNPYRLYGTGTALLAAEDGERLACFLREGGIQTAVIGRLTKGPGRYLHNRQVTRCLEKPRADALLEEG